MEFKEGDVVRLKSGGPEMTIEQVSEQPMSLGKTVASCGWFEVSPKQRVVKRDAFPLAALGTVGDDAEPVSSTPSYF